MEFGSKHNTVVICKYGNTEVMCDMEFASNWIQSKYISDGICIELTCKGSFDRGGLSEGSFPFIHMTIRLWIMAHFVTFIFLSFK